MKLIIGILACTVFLGACANNDVNKLVQKKHQYDVELKQPPAGELISVESLKNDINKVASVIESTHPSPEFTMDVAKVKAKLNSLSREITVPMSQLAAWKKMSLLNPLFNDGHMVLTYPDVNKHLEAHLNKDGKVFPFKVRIDNSKRIYVTDNFNSNQVSLGDEIVSINGLSASDIVESILKRMHGDSLPHRIALTSSRFAKMYWLLYGDTKYYQVDILKGTKKESYSILGSSERENTNDSSINEFVKRDILANNIGYLKIDRFYYVPKHEQAYFRFMDDTWQAFHKANVQDVIIDVRDNPGGTDHYWQLGVAPYIAEEPFLFLSHFKARMTAQNIKRGPIKGKLGSIVEGPFNQKVPIKKHNKLRIPGKAYLLMGPLSYSSSVLFLTALQDSGQAIIAGSQSGVRSCTTGRIETVNLSGSKLDITFPTLIYTRPAGKEMCQAPIVPDILIKEDPNNKNVIVERLIKNILLAR